MKTFGSMDEELQKTYLMLILTAVSVVDQPSSKSNRNYLLFVLSKKSMQI